MRKIIYLVVFLLVVLAITPAIDGLFARRFLENYMARYVFGTGANNESYTVKLKQYQQGWFTSLAIFQVSFNAPQKDYNFSIDIIEDITHGPIIFDKAKHTFKLGFVNTNFKINYPITMQLLLDLPDKNAPFVYGSSLFAFNGSATSDITMNPIITKPIMGTTINWQGFKAVTAMNLVDGLITSINHSANVGELSVTTTTPDSPHGSIAPWTTSATGKLDSAQLWIVQGSANFPHMSFTGLNNATCTIDQFDFKFNHDIKMHTLYSIDYQLSLGKLVLPYGPISTVGPAKIQVVVQDLSAPEILSFYNMVQKNPPSNMKTVEEREAFKNESRDALIKVLTPTTALNINTDINTSLGQFTLTGKLYHFVERPGLVAPDQLQKNTKGELHIKISAGLLKASVKSYIADIQNKALGAGPAVPPSDSAAAAPSNANMDLFDEKVAGYIKAGTITLPDAMSIMSLQKKNLSNADFNSQLAEFHLDKATNDDLVKTYADTHVVASTDAPAPTEAAATTTPPAPPADTNNDAEAQAMIDQFVSQGFLVKENDNYVTTVILENGTVKVNGVLLSQ